MHTATQQVQARDITKRHTLLDVRTQTKMKVLRAYPRADGTIQIEHIFGDMRLSACHKLTISN